MNANQALDALRSVLCDPSGQVCIAGSDGDRAVIAEALESLAAPPASVRGLVEKWRAEALREDCHDVEAQLLVYCADELESALAPAEALCPCGGDINKCPGMCLAPADAGGEGEYQACPHDCDCVGPCKRGYDDRKQSPTPRGDGAVAWNVLQIGNRGAAYDPPNTFRAFTYDKQPDNVVASRLGAATMTAANASAGDSIDRGLTLLKVLHEIGFGVFQINPTHPAPDAAGVGVEMREAASTLIANLRLEARLLIATKGRTEASSDVRVMRDVADWIEKNLTAAALRQSPGVAERDAVDLERFRLPVEAWQSRLDPNDADEADAFTEADNLLAIIDAAGAKGVG